MNTLAGRIGLSSIRTRVFASTPTPPSHPSRLRSTTSTRQNSTTPSAPTSWPPLSPNESLTCKLPDGRTLGFSTYGPDTGYPIFYFHGLPGSRIDARAIKKLDPGLDLRIIGTDRPGMGLSSPQRTRTLTDWPSDVQSLVQHLKLKEFKVFGESGGGPYALACAHAFSQGKLVGLAGTGVMYGIGPMEAGLQDMKFQQWAGLRMIQHLPIWSLRFIYQSVLGLTAKNRDRKSFDDLVHRIFVEGLKLEEKEIIQRPENWRDFCDGLREAFVQGPDGYARDAVLLVGKWDFLLEHVEAKVLLWWGKEDDLAPVRMGRWMMERLRNAEMREYEGETHWTLWDRHGKEILRELMAM